MTTVTRRTAFQIDLDNGSMVQIIRDDDKVQITVDDEVRVVSVEDAEEIASALHTVTAE
jgi:hypothetical protein